MTSDDGRSGPRERWWRLDDAPGSGPWNMAVDEALLEWVAAEGQPVWRFYRWDGPTLSLGYFQQPDERQEHRASANCPAVRRLTGGGAIVHDFELTYSVVVPTGHPLARHRDLLYQVVHGTLVETLAGLGIHAELHPGILAAPGPTPEPFLCFHRRAPGDVVVQGVKVAGSAQRRRRGAVLQHGSVLLAASPAAPELPGLAELLDRPVPGEELANAWLGPLARRLLASWQGSPWTPLLQRRATELARRRYQPF